MSFKKLVASSVCTAVLCTTVTAQETKPAQGATPQPTSVVQGANKMSSPGRVSQEQLAACFALDNQEQIILAKFAQGKTKNKDVIEFTKMIAEEHQACLKKLSKFAPEASKEGYLVATQVEQSRPSEGSPLAAASPSVKTGDAAAPGIDMIQLQRELAQQCIMDSQKYLSTKEGEEFDKCFVGMQIAKHASMRTKLIVSQRHTSDQLQQIVLDGIQVTEKHMKAAEDLMAKLDDADSDSVAKASK
jgi:predicted outer membrane protein